MPSARIRANAAPSAVCASSHSSVTSSTCSTSACRSTSTTREGESMSSGIRATAPRAASSAPSPVVAGTRRRKRVPVTTSRIAPFPSQGSGSCTIERSVAVTSSVSPSVATAAASRRCASSRWRRSVTSRSSTVYTIVPFACGSLEIDASAGNSSPDFRRPKISRRFAICRADSGALPKARMCAACPCR